MKLYVILPLVAVCVIQTAGKIRNEPLLTVDEIINWGKNQLLEIIDNAAHVIATAATKIAKFGRQQNESCITTHREILKGIYLTWARSIYSCTNITDLDNVLECTRSAITAAQRDANFVRTRVKFCYLVN